MLCILDEHKCQYGRSDEEGADWLFLQEVHDSKPFGHCSQIIVLFFPQWKLLNTRLAIIGVASTIFVKY